MFLHNKETGSLVKIHDLQELINPNNHQIIARSQSGEEEQDPEPTDKSNLVFPSGENLPRCWVDADYSKS